jgi:hypothetical protein
MKRLVTAAVLLAASVASPAAAHVVEVTTHVSLEDARDEGKLRRALQVAVDDVLKDTITFTPTVVVVTRALVVGDRLYVRLLMADQEGQRTVEDIVNGERTHRGGEGPSGDEDRGELPI